MEEGRSRWPRLASTDVVDEERVDQPAETTMATGSSFGDPTNEGGTTRWPRPVWTPSTGSVNTSRLTPTGSVACGRAWSGCSWGRGQRPLRGRRRRAQPKAGEGPQPRGGPAPRRERRRRGRRLPRPRGDHPPGRLLAEDHEGWMVARHSMGVESLRATQAVVLDQEVALGLPHASSWSPGDTVVVVHPLDRTWPAWLPPGAPTPTSVLSTVAWRRGEERSAPSWRSPTPSSWPSTTCSRTAPPTRTSGPTPSIASTVKLSSAAACVACSGWATRSRSRRPLCRDLFSGEPPGSDRTRGDAGVRRPLPAVADPARPT